MDTVRENLSEGMEYEKAVDVAIDTMDDNSVLKKYLEKHRAGVKESMSTAVKNLYDSMRKDNMNHTDAVSFVAKIFNIADKEAEKILKS